MNTAVNNQDNLYRILSLDGGGSWALIEAAALGDIYGLNTSGHDILAHFNLAVANSGGSIVLAALILNMTPSEILDILFDESIRKSIFDKKNYDIFGLLGFRKYKTQSKLKGLKKAFSNKQIDIKLTNISETFNLTTDIVITAFDYDRERAKFFRSKSNSKAGGGVDVDVDVSLLHAIHASSTAPVKYFDDPAYINDGKSRRFWDGGVAGYNNPVMVGVIEALSNNQKRENIKILSIGSGNNFLPIWQAEDDLADKNLYKHPQLPMFITDIGLVATAIVSDPPDAASFTAHVVLGGQLPPADSNNSDPSQFVEPLVRMNPLVQPKKKNKDKDDKYDKYDKWDYPTGLSPYEFITLTKLGLDAIENNEVNAIRQLTKAWLENDITNQGIRVDGLTLEHEIGHTSYSSALEQWLKQDSTALANNPNQQVNNHQEVLNKLKP